jgi:hypothetical protein
MTPPVFEIDDSKLPFACRANEKACWASILINDVLPINLLMSNYTRPIAYLYRRYITKFSDNQILKRCLLSRMEWNDIISYES